MNPFVHIYIYAAFITHKFIVYWLLLRSGVLKLNMLENSCYGGGAYPSLLFSNEHSSVFYIVKMFGCLERTFNSASVMPLLYTILYLC